MKMEQTECSETSAYKIQTSENYPEESTQHPENGESLKSRIHLNMLNVAVAKLAIPFIFRGMSV
jgi:hypothetical protein